MNIKNELAALLDSTVYLTDEERDYFRAAIDSPDPVRYAWTHDGPGRRLIVSLANITVFQE